MKILLNLDLSKEQIEEVKKLYRKNKRTMIKLRGEIQLKKIDFQEELQKEQLNKKALDVLIADIVRITAKNKENRLKTQVKIMTILTPAQKDKLSELMTNRMLSGEGFQRESAVRRPR